MKRVALAVSVFVFMATFQIFASHDASAAQYGKASYYWQPQALASGGRFNPNAMSAAHKTLPFGTRVRVTRQSTGRSVVVIINDRGPYISGRIIDLSRAAARRLGMTAAGVTRVRVDVIGRGSVRKLALGGGGGKHVGKPKRRASASSSGKPKPGASTSSSGKPKRSASSSGKKRAAGKPKRRASASSSGKKRPAGNRAGRKKQRFAGIPKSLRGKRIISVKRRYRLAGKTRTTSGRIPKGATLLMEEITYIN